jgi:hypothetical protein
VSWDLANLVRQAPGSDLWPFTWAADDHLYTSWGDGGGFGGANRDGRVSLGFARIEGPPENFIGVNVWGGKNAENPATFEGKCGAMLSVDGVLYAWIILQNAEPPDIKLAWSSNFSKSWQLVDGWSFHAGDLNPGFLNFGRNYAGARDEYVYIYGQPWTSDGHLYMARVPKDQLKNRDAYEFFKGLDADGNPLWASGLSQRRPVFSDPNGVDGTSMIFNPGIGRYLLTAAHTGVGQLGIFDAPEPWGPWTTVAYYDTWGGFGDTEALGHHLPTKWISADGKVIWVVFSSGGVLDSFNLVKGTLTLKSNIVSPVALTGLGVQ